MRRVRWQYIFVLFQGVLWATQMCLANLTPRVSFSEIGNRADGLALLEWRALGFATAFLVAIFSWLESLNCCLQKAFLPPWRRVTITLSLITLIGSMINFALVPFPFWDQVLAAVCVVVTATLYCSIARADISDFESKLPLLKESQEHLFLSCGPLLKDDQQEEQQRDSFQKGLP
ncbi:hypothetical protein Pelo_11602 [Pelomyxa schiedti]|nr:hypothetical protein Pelo_11602 [Pelomyxa schiedti]